MEIKKTRETDELMKDTEAFLLLFKIAYHTKTNKDFTIPDCPIGWAFITAEIVGLTQSVFRKNKNKLVKWGFIEVKTTNKGTFARVTTDKFFII